MTDDEQPDEVRTNLHEAIRAWYAAGHQGNAVLTSFYVIAAGVGFDDDGDQLAHIAQDWDASIVEQLGLAKYMTMRIEDRLREDTNQ